MSSNLFHHVPLFFLFLLLHVWRRTRRPRLRRPRAHVRPRRRGLRGRRHVLVEEALVVRRVAGRHLGRRRNFHVLRRRRRNLLREALGGLHLAGEAPEAVAPRAAGARREEADVDDRLAEGAAEDGAAADLFPKEIKIFDLFTTPNLFLRHQSHRTIHALWFERETKKILKLFYLVHTDKHAHYNVPEF